MDNSKEHRKETERPSAGKVLFSIAAGTLLATMLGSLTVNAAEPASNQQVKQGIHCEKSTKGKKIDKNCREDVPLKNINEESKSTNDESKNDVLHPKDPKSENPSRDSLESTSSFDVEVSGKSFAGMGYTLKIEDAETGDVLKTESRQVSDSGSDTAGYAETTNFPDGEGHYRNYIVTITTEYGDNQQIVINADNFSKNEKKGSEQRYAGKVIYNDSSSTLSLDSSGVTQHLG